MKVSLTSKEEKDLENQRDLISRFQHIKDLKAGDVLRYTKSGGYRLPELGSLVVVYSVLPAVENEESRGRIHENDFTLLISDSDGDIMQFAFDSRFFDKVELN